VNPSDLDSILDRARRRDPAAFDALVTLFGDRVFGLIYRLLGQRELAEDLTQETFLRVVRTIESYEHDGRFEAWIFRIAANLARDHARKRKRRGTMASLDAGEPDEPGISLPDNNADPSGVDGMIQAEQESALQAALDRLSPADREIVMLRHFADLSFKDIAEMLSIPLGTALARAHRALKKLRADLDPDELPESSEVSRV
jgi:RNA polymerase sigma-70 factor (ECF subfamily)